MNNSETSYRSPAVPDTPIRGGEGSQGLATAVSWLFVAAVLSLALPFHYLFDTPVEFLRLDWSALQNLLVLTGASAVLVVCGIRHWLNPVLVAVALLLVLSFTLSLRYPGLTANQSLQTAGAFALGALIFELRLNRRTVQLLRTALPWMGLINLATGVLLWLFLARPAYMWFFGALRLEGAATHAQLAYLGLVGLLFSLVAALDRPRWLFLAAVNFGIVVWSGSRMPMLEAAILIAGWLLAVGWGERRAARPFWTRGRLALAVSLPVIFLSYGPFLYERMTGFRSLSTEGFELGWSDDKERWSLRVDDGERGGETPAASDDAEGATGEGPGGLQVTTTGRLGAWRYYWEVATTAPWFGRGLGASVVAGVGHMSPTYYVPHNTYLRVLVDTGWVGLILLIGAFAWMAKRLCHAASSLTHRTFILTLFAIFALDALVRNPMSAQHFMIAFWLSLGILSGELPAPRDSLVRRVSRWRHRHDRAIAQ